MKYTLNAASVWFIAFLLCLPVHAATPDIRVLYKKNVNVTIFEDASVLITLTSNQNYNGTRGFCRATPYFSYQGVLRRTKDKPSISFGNTSCRYTPGRVTQNTLCSTGLIGNQQLAVIWRDDTGKYLGEAKLDFIGDCMIY